MSKNATLTPINRLFNELRQDIKELRNKRDLIDQQLLKLEQLEAGLVENHSNPLILSILDYRAVKEDGKEEEPEDLIEEEEREETPRLKLAEAIIQQFAPPDKRLTAPETQMILEDMRQRGELDTKSKEITYDRTIKTLRRLTKENVLAKENTKAGNRVIQVYRLVEKG